MTGLNPDGTRRNLTVPTHVPWTGGVMGTTYDPTVRWTTGLEGLSSNKGTDARVLNERIEHPGRIAAATDASDDRIGQTS